MPVQGGSPLLWETGSQASLNAIKDVMRQDDYFKTLSLLWSQESNKTGGTTELRPENIAFIKSLGRSDSYIARVDGANRTVTAKMFEAEGLDQLLLVIDPLLSDADKFKQRSGAEFLTGLLRGSKHWPRQLSDKLWSWTTTRLNDIFAQIKPDTLPFWESVFNVSRQFFLPFPCIQAILSSINWKIEILVGTNHLWTGY